MHMPTNNNQLRYIIIIHGSIYAHLSMQRQREKTRHLIRRTYVSPLFNYYITKEV